MSRMDALLQNWSVCLMLLLVLNTGRNYVIGSDKEDTKLDVQFGNAVGKKIASCFT